MKRVWNKAVISKNGEDRTNLRAIKTKMAEVTGLFDVGGKKERKKSLV